MKVSSRSDYAIRVVLELAEAGYGVIVTAANLEARAGVPRKYLTLLMRDLQTRQVVRGIRGANGGFTLGRTADRITVGEVIRLMDGPLAPIPCASLTAHIPCPTSLCHEEANCVQRDMWLRVRQAISDVVDTTTFADLVAKRRESRRDAPPAYSI